MKKMIAVIIFVLAAFLCASCAHDEYSGRPDTTKDYGPGVIVGHWVADTTSNAYWNPADKNSKPLTNYIVNFDNDGRWYTGVGSTYEVETDSDGCFLERVSGITYIRIGNSVGSHGWVAENTGHYILPSK